MAINLTVAALASAVRAGNTTEESAELTRLLTYAKTEISRYLGRAYTTAPQSVVNEAAIRLVAYLYDMPNASRGAAFANALRNSGAGRMLLGYRVHRAGTSTALRLWSSALIRAAIDAVLPADERLVPANGSTGDMLLRQANGVVWTSFRSAVLSVAGQGQGGGVGPLVTRTFTSNATAQRYSATGFTPPTDWTLLALEDRQATQVFSGLTIIDLEYMRGVPAMDRPAAGGAYPAVDAGQGVYALDATGQLLAATFAASVAHTLIYRRLG